MSQAAVHVPSKPLAPAEFPLTMAPSDRPDPAFPANDRAQADLGDHLVVSPYATVPHLLDLTKLEESPRLLAKALTVLQSVRQDYATAPYHLSFNWDAVIDELKSLVALSQYQWRRQQFYIVVFRSQVPPTTDRIHLDRLDQKSHAEATTSGGLLKYWFGLPDANGKNLATCTYSALYPTARSKSPQLTLQPGIWRNHADARAASLGPGHKEAIRASVKMYTELKLERIRFDIGDDANTWSITPWEE